jgi:hypothetical protein
MSISYAQLIALIGLLITVLVATVTVIRFLGEARDRAVDNERRYSDHETRIQLLEEIVERLSRMVDNPNNKSRW